MRLWHVECVVTDGKLYDLMLYLEKIKAYNVVNKVYANGKDDEPEPKNINRKERGKHQNEWFQKYVTTEMTPAEIRAIWEKGGHNPKLVYAALSRAVNKKILKKLASGNYKPVGA